MPVARLTDVMSAEALRHLASLEQDVMQLQSLLDASINGISAGFSEIAVLAAPSRDPAPASTLPCSGPGVPAGTVATPSSSCTTLGQIAKVASHLAIQLQFHDMTSQVLSRSVHRIEGLRKLIADVRGGLFDPGRPHQPVVRTQQMQRVAIRLEKRSRSLDALLRQRVTQRDMQPGAADLF